MNIKLGAVTHGNLDIDQPGWRDLPSHTLEAFATTAEAEPYADQLLLELMDRQVALGRARDYA